MERDILKILGAKIRELRTARNLSQIQLAEMSHVNKNYIGMLERGEVNPTYLTLLAISKALGKSITI